VPVTGLSECSHVGGTPGHAVHGRISWGIQRWSKYILLIHVTQFHTEFSLWASNPRAVIKLARVGLQYVRPRQYHVGGTLGLACQPFYYDLKCDSFMEKLKQ
jgi:hypothetical protein